MADLRQQVLDHAYASHPEVPVRSAASPGLPRKGDEVEFAVHDDETITVRGYVSIYRRPVLDGQ